MIPSLQNGFPDLCNHKPKPLYIAYNFLQSSKKVGKDGHLDIDAFFNTSTVFNNFKDEHWKGLVRFSIHFHQLLQLQKYSHS
jgi:hypothetical protein